VRERALLWCCAENGAEEEVVQYVDVPTGTNGFFPWGEVANSVRLNIWLCLVLRVRMSELCLRVWTGTTLPFNFHLGSWVHEQPILIKWSLTCRNPRFQLTVMVLFHSRWLFCACSILNVIAVCCSIAYYWAVLSGAFFNPKPTTLCKYIPGWRLHHFLFSFLQAWFLSLRILLKICSQNVLNSEGAENVAFYVHFINRHKWCNTYFQWKLILVLKHVKRNCRLGLKIRACTMPSEKHNVVLLPEPF